MDLRGLVNAIFYIVRGACAWRMLPKEYPPWQTVDYDFARFKREGIWQKIHDALRTRVGVHHGRPPQPTAAIQDGQSVKTTEKAARGYDAGKKASGRKRHVLGESPWAPNRSTN